MFNPLHPKVQKAILNLIQEIAQKYGKFPAFRGVSLNVWHSGICWFATPEIGYDDFTVNLFSHETGIKIPGEPTAADRFSTRYEFLMKYHRDRWLDWRCAKISNFFREMRDTLRKEKPDLEFTISLWSETTVSQLLGTPNSPKEQLFSRKNTYNLYRDGGIDIRLLQDEPGISVDYVFTPSRDRDSWGTGGVTMKLEQLCMFHDHDYLDDATLTAVKENRTPSAFIFDSWVEAWGKYSNFPIPDGGPLVKEYAQAWSVPEDRISHHNSEYPKDGFWWNWQFRITPQFPGGVHYLEPYTQALAELDALEITRGGLFLDSGHAELIQSFARAFRMLPAVKFDTVGTSTDPVAVRTILHNNQRYLYLVNREYYPVQVNLKFDKPSVPARDLSAYQNIRIDAANIPITLSPYRLIAFTLPPDVQINNFETTVPAEISEPLIRHAEAALQQIDHLMSHAVILPAGTDKMVEMIKETQTKKQFSKLRHALDSYIIRKCGELAEKLDAK